MPDHLSKAWTYERLVKQVYERLLHSDPDVVVHHRKTYLGRQSGQQYEIDISFEFTKASVTFLVLVECKFYSKKVEVGDAAAFAFKLQDIGAQKGILVSTVGFQKGVFNVAVSSGIALVIVNEPDSGDVILSSRGPKSEFDYAFDEYRDTEYRGGALPVLGIVESSGEPPEFFASLHLAWNNEVDWSPWCKLVEGLADPGEGEAQASALIKQARHERAQRKYSQAVMLAEAALKIRESSVGSDDVRVAEILNLITGLYEKTGRYEDAESAAIRALQIRQRELGATHPDVATSLNNLATVYIAQGRDQEAEDYLGKARTIAEGRPDGALLPSIDCNLANVYGRTGRHSEAAALYEAALERLQQTLGRDHPTVAEVGERYAAFLEETGHTKQSLTIR